MQVGVTYAGDVSAIHDTKSTLFPGGQVDRPSNSLSGGKREVRGHS